MTANTPAPAPKPAMKFVTSPKNALALKAAGFKPASTVPPCEFSVGDFVTFPASTDVAFKVVGRWCLMEDDGVQWQIMLAPTAHPSSLPEMKG
jgi:hypothetical protein